MGGSGFTKTPEPTQKNRRANLMKPNAWYLLAIVPVAMLATRAEVGAQLVILGLTLGIFFGTLSLGRPRPGDATTTNPGH